MKVLLIRFSSAGDILLLNDAIKFLKNQNKNIDINLLTKDAYRDMGWILGVDCVTIKKENGILKKIYSFINIINLINKKKIDIIFDFQNSLKSRFILLFLKAKKKFIFNKNIIKRRLMVLFKWFINEQETISEKYLKLVRRVFKSDIKTLTKTKNLYKLKKIRNIVIGVGAKWKLKRWPYYLELIELLKKLKGIKLIIVGLKEEVEKNSDLLYIKGENIINKIGATDLKGLYKIISKADFLIGNDTMVAHMAAINNVPGIVIMGPTVKAFGFISERNFLVLEKNIACRPCHLHGGTDCPIGTFKCMSEINAEYVYKKFIKYLKVRV